LVTAGSYSNLIGRDGTFIGNRPAVGDCLAQFRVPENGPIDMSIHVAGRKIRHGLPQRLRGQSYRCRLGQIEQFVFSGSWSAFEPTSSFHHRRACGRREPRIESLGQGFDPSVTSPTPVQRDQPIGTDMPEVAWFSNPDQKKSVAAMDPGTRHAALCRGQSGVELYRMRQCLRLVLHPVCLDWLRCLQFVSPSLPINRA